MVSIEQIRLPELLTDEKAALMHQRKRDLVGRHRPGVFFYPMVWLLITGYVFTTPDNHQKLIWLGTVGGVLLTSCGYRYFWLRRFVLSLSQEQDPPLWWLTHGMLVCAFAWGIFFALTLTATPLSAHYTLILTATLALCSGGAATLCIMPTTVSLLLLGLLGPATLISLTPLSQQPPALGALLLIFALGMIWVGRLPRREYESAVLSTIKLSQQAEYLTRLTTLDGLTGVRNRRSFDEILESEVRRANRLQYPLSLLMIDIDHFKAVNDIHGHLVGDACLVATASALQKHIQRTGDVIARYGGEEFAVILPGVAEADAQELAETLREEVAGVVTWHLNEPLQITISLGGVTMMAGPVSRPEDYLSLADRALYEAKHWGRNRTVWATPTGQLVAVDRMSETSPPTPGKHD